ncbi:hypothetical protein AKJ09_06291 [Labilithrix luteola]|uniref:Uncharacterized protein n=1 Tax=Labilithrix luteola TaxID=1391654 RepID=A0A0K1Q1L5_9BACT|nr:hypothetical protein [Labilithrix luteola]AKU99627.1 hypothetical protein AKJ09_06291 [Labilithrix luteola]
MIGRLGRDVLGFRVLQSLESLLILGLVAGVSVVACSSSPNATTDANGASSDTTETGAEEPADQVDAPEDGGADAAADAGVVITGKCANTFGDKLTDAFGRIDGIVYSVQKPSDKTCVMPNNDHVILQVLMNGAVYRLVINVQSDRPDQDVRVRYGTMTHALPAPAFAEGWHTDAPLDYVTSLDAHTTAAFQPYALGDLVSKLADAIHPGQQVSVYGTSANGRHESAHLIHRNKTNMDGAIVLEPTSASPTFHLFHFATQTF